MKAQRAVKVEFHTLLTLHCMELSSQLHAPTTFPQERTRYPLNTRLCGRLSWSGCLVTIVNQYCLFCFSLIILACVALLDVHMKISWHSFRDCKIKILVINRRKHYSIWRDLCLKARALLTIYQHQDFVVCSTLWRHTEFVVFRLLYISNISVTNVLIFFSVYEMKSLFLSCSQCWKRFAIKCDDMDCLYSE